MITQKAVELLGPLGYSTSCSSRKMVRDAKINDIYGRAPARSTR